MNSRRAVGAYIHVPFCRSKCPYCDFYSVMFDELSADSYVNALVDEINAAGEFAADTVYFGGGTPSLLGAARLERILKALPISSGCEITLECNPKTVDAPLLKDYRALGINRLSIGAQSFCDDELRALGRIHSARDAKQAVADAQAAGFENLSLDLMLATPGQTVDSLVCSVKTAAALGVPHVSAYILSIEKNTRFHKTEVALPEDGIVARIYLNMAKELEAAGIKQYEISNFAKAGFESRHNLKYWRCEEYYGFGPSAHSFVNSTRCCHERNVQDYIKSKGGIIRVTDQNAGGFDEYAMLRLRLVEGLSLEEAFKKFAGERKARDVICALPQRAKPYENAGLLTISGENDKAVIALTPKGFLVSNALIAELVL